MISRQIAILILAAIGCTGLSAQRTTRRNLHVARNVAATTNESDTIRDVTAEQIKISGYDKPLRSGKETFFVSNHTDRDIESVAVRLEYLDQKGRSIHRRECIVGADIPAGETRQVSVKSWDVQNAFYYKLSARPKRADATPYDVRCTIIYYTTGK